MSSITNERLHSQRLVGSEFTTAKQVVSWLGALQGQDLASATWSIGLRLPGSTQADIERAFASGEIVRTWVMRGTLFVVAAEDVRWMLALTAPGNIKRAVPRHRELGLDEKILAKGRKTIAKALEEKHLTREEVYAALERARIFTEGQRGYHLLWDAAVHGVICSGAPRGKEQTYALLDEWIPATPSKSREESIAELARRYFQSRAPATLKDFAWWSGLSLKGLTLTPTLSHGLAQAALRHSPSVVARRSRREREKGWETEKGGEEKAGEKKAGEKKCFALPGFDELLLGYQNRSAVLDARFVKRIFPGGGTFIPSLVLDGKVVGKWTRATLDYETFTKVNKKPLEAALQRYGQFTSRTAPPSRRARSAD